MKKYIIYYTLIFIIALSCSKNENDDNAQSSMRVTKIEGRNDYWGDFVYKIYYSNNKIDTAYRFNSEGRKVGSISRGESNGVITYSFYDIVVSIDQDSIDRLETRLNEAHGVGNYSLIDSISTSNQAIYKVGNTIIDNNITKQEFTFFRPRKFFGKDKDYNVTYIQTLKETIMYEYSDNHIINSRCYRDIFTDSTSTEKYDRSLFKAEYVYSGDKVVSNSLFRTNQWEQSNWELIDKLDYVYDNNMIQAVSGTKFSKVMQYSGKTLQSVTVDGKVIQYQFNDKGYVTRIDYGDGNYMNITYENGVGNFSEVWYVDEIQKGLPIIR